MRPFTISIPTFDWSYNYTKKKFGFGIRLCHTHTNYTGIYYNTIWIIGLIIQGGIRFKEKKK